MNAITVVDNSIMTGADLDQLFNNWVEFIDATPKTVETYTRAIRQFMHYCNEQGIYRLEDITTQDVRAYRDALKQDHKPTTVQAYLMAVKQFYKWVEEITPLKNVAKNVKGAKLTTEHKKDALTPVQVKMVLETCDKTTAQGLRDYAILTLMFTCGLRTVEVTRADVKDLRAFGNGTALYVQGKGRAEKDEPVKVAEAQERILRDYLKERNPQSLDEPLFISGSNRNKGGRLTTKSISRIVDTYFIKAGIKTDRITPHCTRHTAITQAIKNGASMEEAQQFARHTNLNTTLIYAHNLEKQNNPCANLIAEALL